MDEVTFWREFFRSQGGQWSDEYRDRIDPHLLMQDHLATMLSQVNRSPVDVLENRTARTLAGDTRK
ncbi:MAG: hypothetical protein M1318_04175 [Firmicutes bacterium]|nr:hypothetical protein [Bacillota bacterium]